MPATALETIGNVTAATRKIAADTIAALEEDTRYRVNTTWGYDPDEGNTEHHSGKAVDFMCSEAAGDWIVEHLWQHRDAYGLTHVIWRQRIRSTVVSPGVWRDMEDRGSVTKNHMDHVHAYFGRTPSSPSTITPAPKPAVRKAPHYPLRAGQYFGPGSVTRSRHLATWQRQMARRGWRIAVDGIYGPQTAAVAAAFQKEKKLNRDKLIGPQTWAAAWTAPIT